MQDSCVSTHNIIGLQFQLQLMVFKECSEWIPGKLEKFTQLLVETMEEQCQCGLTVAHITEEELACSQEMENGVIFSARLSKTMQASTTDLIGLLGEWNMERILIPVGTDSEMLTEIVVEGLLTPSCFRTVDSTFVTSAVRSIPSGMLSLSEIVMWIAIPLLICAVVLVFILSAVVLTLRRQLNKASCKSRFVSAILICNFFFFFLPLNAIMYTYREKQKTNDISTSANVCYHYIEHHGSSESQVDGGDSVTSHTLQIYEEIEHSNDDFCVIYD